MARKKKSRENGSPRGTDRKGVGPRRWNVSRLALWAALGASISLLLAFAAFDPYLFTGGDNARYYALAKALATGRGYVDLVSPGAPLHVQYPPGFPALLVPFYIVSGGSLVAMKTLPWLAAAVLLAGVWLLARRDSAITGWAVVAAVWTVGLYHATQTYAHRLLSDLPYAAAVALALAVLQGAVTDGVDRDRLDATWIGGCVLAVGAFYLRIVGLTLLGAITVWALLTRRWKRACVSIAISAAGLLPGVLASSLYRRALLRTGDYFDQLSLFNTIAGSDGRMNWSGVFERLEDTAVEYAFFQFPGLFWPSDPPPVEVRIVGLSIGGALVVWGVVRALRSRGVAPWDIYVVATLAILPLWPWLGDRYMLTLAPFLWLYLLVGLDDASRRLVGAPTFGVAAVGTLCAFLLLAHVRELPRQWDRTRDWLDGDQLAGYDPFWRDYFSAAQWIGENAPENAVVLARKPTLVWYWSGRTAIDWPFWESGEEKWRYIRSHHVSHILIEPESARNLLEVFTAYAALQSMPFYRSETEVAVFTLALPSGSRGQRNRQPLKPRRSE